MALFENDWRKVAQGVASNAGVDVDAMEAVARRQRRSQLAASAPSATTALTNLTTKAPWEYDTFRMDRPEAAPNPRQARPAYLSPFSGEPAEAQAVAKPKVLKRRGLYQQVEAAPAVQVQGARAVSGDTRGAEAERQARLSDIDSALFSLRGNLNMRSKRDMFTNLLGMKNELTRDAYRTQNDRDVTGAQMANETAQANAGFADAAARRRDAANQFNSELGWDATKWSVDRLDDQRAAAAKANADAPFNQLKLAKAVLDMQKLEADQARAADRFDLERGGLFEGVLKARSDAMRKQNVPEERIAIEAAKSAQALGVDPYSAPTPASGADSIKQQVSDLFSTDNVPVVNAWGWFGDSAAPGSRFTASELSPDSIRDFSAVRPSETGWARRWFLGAPDYRFEVTDARTGRKESRYSDNRQLYDDLRALRRWSVPKVNEP